MDGVVEFIRGVPPVTLLVAGSGLASGLLLRLGLLPARAVVFSGAAVLRGQLWRLLTAALVWPLSFQALISLYTVSRALLDLERTHFGASRPDKALWMLCCLLPPLWLAGALLRAPLLSPALATALIYVWSRAFPDIQTSFMFGIRFRNIYTPWVLTAFRFLLGGSPALDLAGIATGHLYFFLADILPKTHGRHLLAVPAWFSRLVARLPFLAPARGNVPRPNPNNPNPNPNNAMPAGHQWGRGNPLGQ